MAVGDFGDQARPVKPTPPVILTRQLGLDSRLVQEDEAESPSAGPPGRAERLAGRYDIRPVLFGGVQDFFFTVRPKWRTARQDCGQH